MAADCRTAAYGMTPAEVSSDLGLPEAPSARSAVPILVVDDDASKRLALKAVLSRLGHSIVEADSGEAALRRVMAQEFAVILLDVKMPHMDGFETAARIRTRQQSELTPIIFITAYATNEIVPTARYVEGAVDFMFAPVQPDELRAKVSVFANLFIQAALLAAHAREVQGSADRLRTLTDAAPIGIFQTDGESRYVYTNPRWTEITGIPPQEADGLKWEAIIALADRAAHFNELPRDAGDTGESCRRFEIRGDGRASRIVLATSEPILDPDRGIAGWVGTLADVTAAAREREAEAARRDAEGRYRQIVETTMEGVWVIDAENCTTFANQAMAEMLATSVADIQGRSLFEFYEYEHQAGAKGSISRRRAGSNEQFEAKLRRSDGTEMHALLSTSPFLDAEGTYVGALAMVRDISERVEQETRRDALEEQLRQSQRLESIGQLAGGIAHDFNNLLLGIRGFGELALGRLGRDDDKAGEYIKDILEAADRATQLTRQLLAFGRRQVLQPEVLDLSQVVTGMQRLLGPLVGEHAELIVVSPDAPVLVLADRSQIEQVIMNLAVNARDAMLDGGQLTIEVSVSSGQSPEAVLAVSDTGCGMDAETIALVFEPFYTTKGDAGTGLGLATVHGIVSQSGGRVGLESRIGSGSTFSIFLPLSNGTLALPAASPVEEEGGADTILVVEDDPMVSKIVTGILEGLGYCVLTAAGGEAALELADAWPSEIDLILTDSVMPGLSGRETATRLRERRPDARVLYMSGYTDDIALRGGSFDPGMSFIQKPFGANDLARHVRDALELELL